MAPASLEVDFLGRRYATPLWAASGTFGWGVEAVDGGFFPKKGLGALVTKGVSPSPMHGAPQPRVAEVGSGTGLLNAIGLQNPGLDLFLTKYATRYEKGDLGVPVWVNAFADSLEGYVEVISKVVDFASRGKKSDSWLAGFELNVSCPNVKKGGLEFGADPKGLELLVAACVKAAGATPVMVKLSPLFSQVVDLGRASETGGARALSVANTMLAGFPEPEKKSVDGTVAWSIGRRFGGLSGPALRPIALRMVDQLARALPLPICGVGGIQSAHDVREFLAAGARVVQVGTANFANPWVCDEIARGLAASASSS